MKDFAFAQPRSEQAALELLSPQPGKTVILAGGTDLVGLMKRLIVTPERVVHIGRIDSLRRIDEDTQGNLWVGAAVRLEEWLEDRRLALYPAVSQVIQNISSPQLRNQGTVGGELLHRPRCWYFRSGFGLLADGGRMVAQGDNRYHAILGNQGPSKFVHASRLAPPLISLAARVRVVGPGPKEETFLPLESFYHIPAADAERETVLQANQLVTHVILPAHSGQLSAAYEVRHGVGPEPPLAAAAATLVISDGLVREAKLVLGQVAPVPWVAAAAAASMLSRRFDRQLAEQVSHEAVAAATPLSENQYKIQLAQVALLRALLLAAGIDPGGL